MGPRAMIHGFTLIELMIVVAIIAVIAAIAIPSLLIARISGNESSAISSLRTISTVTEQYNSRFSQYAPSSPFAGEHRRRIKLHSLTPPRTWPTTH